MSDLIHSLLTSRLTSRAIPWILLILTIIPAFVPLRLPIREDPITKAYCEYLLNMKEGATFIRGWYAERGFTQYEISKFDLRVMMRFYAGKHLKMILVPFAPGMEAAWEELSRFSGLERDFGYVYGVDYVILPLVPGDEVAFAAIANNIKGTVSRDNRGTPIDQIPLLKNINTLNDIDYAELSCEAALVPAVIRQWGTAFPNRPNMLMGMSFSVAGQYYPHIVKAVTDVMTEAYFQQRYAKDAGERLIMVDALNTGSWFYLILFTLGVIDFRIQRAKGVRVAQATNKEGA